MFETRAVHDLWKGSSEKQPIRIERLLIDSVYILVSADHYQFGHVKTKSIEFSSNFHRSFFLEESLLNNARGGMDPKLVLRFHTYNFGGRHDLCYKGRNNEGKKEKKKGGRDKTNTVTRFIIYG